MQKELNTKTLSLVKRLFTQGKNKEQYFYARVVSKEILT